MASDGIWINAVTKEARFFPHDSLPDQVWPTPRCGPPLLLGLEVGWTIWTPQQDADYLIHRRGLRPEVQEIFITHHVAGLALPALSEDRLQALGFRVGEAVIVGAVMRALSQRYPNNEDDAAHGPMRSESFPRVELSSSNTIHLQELLQRHCDAYGGFPVRPLSGRGHHEAPPSPHQVRLQEKLRKEKWIFLSFSFFSFSFSFFFFFFFSHLRDQPQEPAQKEAAQ